ncbi:MAG TPA: recombinase, partial [Lachnospiraceae bacterium]|nr:recombinase [Lachnospiraceae bacterium]
IYLRLSKEDGDVAAGSRQESNSISNQKSLVQDYLESQKDIEVVSVRIDDGYSGVDFNRPEFQAMMKDIRDRKVDCVIVKDLSRFGRNYIEVGRYIEKIFPILGVRFIAINDNYDSINENNSEIVTAFKNLVNDSYIRDLSVKIRSNLEAKRKKGEFTGSFAAYGYRKSETNKGQLVVDEFAAGVIRDIFNMKLGGMSPGAIADKLNDSHILSPMEYKTSMGENFRTSFKTNKKAKWAAGTVLRILGNELYTGVLVQGKRGTPNHKIKRMEVKDKKDWIRADNTHEAIIDKFYYDTIQRIMERETRRPPSGKGIYLLGGLIYCGNCGKPMIHKICKGRKKHKDDIPNEYVYYVCKTNKEVKGCSGHRISEKVLFDTVFKELKYHIRTVLDVEDVLGKIDKVQLNEIQVKKLNAHILCKQEELMKAAELKSGIYEDFKDGILDREEYQSLKTEFNNRIEEAKEAISLYNDEKRKLADNKNPKYEWMEYFKKYKELKELTREAAVIFIDRILIYEGNRIKIRYTFGDQLKDILECLTADTRKEAM